ncbi:3-oxoacyl-ACP synthase III family protein [Saccharomonospora glauca]|uniref:3-oxoacyl-(Acyl-carrier-protein) synthase III n=1 Tax=Saccharomonospora glauca K62 TaxID=928724 RepID=I1D2F9_9PSEU|nr:ketoacyl-ACP synthase III [Saccharomonospora glauca]EIE99133.1 3-oxoacyl-(acyl-carrier-protein) synthase III [Saccharomonospora glauca K62]
MSTGILGAAGYLPPRVIDNDQVGAWVDRDPDWILERTGIKERHYAAPEVSTSDMACLAVEKLYASCPEKRASVGAVILGTSTPDHNFPSTAAIVQGRMGLGRAFAFDLSAACSGYLFSFVTAHSLLSANPALEEVLVIGADTISKVLYQSDRKTVTVFGDGAAATRVGRVPDGYGLLTHTLITDGCHADYVGQPAGGSRRPLDATTVNARERYMVMHGRKVREYFEEVVPKLIHEVVEQAGVSLDDIDHFVFHQANPQMLADCINAMGIDPAKCPVPGVLSGNTGAASIPLVLSELRAERGDLVVMAAIGSGMTAGAAVLRWY